jgi:hypothetical protein
MNTTHPITWHLAVDADLPRRQDQDTSLRRADEIPVYHYSIREEFLPGGTHSDDRQCSRFTQENEEVDYCVQMREWVRAVASSIVLPDES